MIIISCSDTLVCNAHNMHSDMLACFAWTAFSNAELLQLLTVLLVALEVNKKR